MHAEKTPAQVLVAGCGDLGSGLARLCNNADGLQVTGLRRRALADDFPVLVADLCNPDSLSLLPDQFDYVVYTATPGERTPQAYREIYVNGLQHLLARLDLQRLRRVFFVSSTAVYGQQQGEWVDEHSVTEPRSFSGQILLEAERWLQNEPVASTVIRFAGIYGPGREWLIRKTLQGSQAVQDPPSYTNRIHRDDCVGLLRHLLLLAERGSELPPALIGVDQEPVSEWDVLTWLAEKLDVAAPQAITGDGKQNKRCRSVWLHRLGYELRYPGFRAGYAELVSEFLARSSSVD